MALPGLDIRQPVHPGASQRKQNYPDAESSNKHQSKSEGEQAGKSIPDRGHAHPVIFHLNSSGTLHGQADPIRITIIKIIVERGKRRMFSLRDEFSP
jgi:hypothetical protein